MPPECKEFVECTKINFETTNKLLYSIPLHRLWRTKNWRKMVNAQGTMLSYASKLVEEKMKEIEEGMVAEEAGDVHAELGDDFLTHMVHSSRTVASSLEVVRPYCVVIHNHTHFCIFTSSSSP